MEQGITPGQALQKWAEHAEALVKLFKANRRQAVLIDVAIARQNPEQAITALASHWQLEIDPVPNATTAPTEPTNSFYQLVANAAVQQETQLHPLLAQLEACTLPLVDTEATAEASQDVDALYTQLNTSWQELETAKQQGVSHQQQLHQTEQQFTELQQESSELKRAKTDYEKELVSAREESQLLLEQLHLVQEELESKFLQASEQEQSQAKLKTQLEQAQTQAKNTEKQYTQTEQARAKAGQEKAKIEQEKTRIEQTLAKAEQTAKAEKEEQKNLQAALKKEQTGHTKTSAEKATLENQLKALKAANKDQAGQLENLAEENQLLLEQLHLVQEELENKFLQAREQEKFLANLKTQLEQKDSQYTTSQKEAGLLQRRLQKLRDTLENLERTNRALNGNLSELKNQLAASKKHQADWEQKYLQAERNGTLALAAANRRIAELSTELNKVTKSLSWKLANSTAGYSKKTKKAAADKLRQQKAEIESSGLFDETWYLEHHQDVAEAGLNPIEHYLKIGAYEGRNPSESFDTTWYLIYYRDVTESGLNPLVHYLRYGQAEERASRAGALVSLPAPLQAEEQSK
jgi:chromosome segregation ATPase